MTQRDTGGPAFPSFVTSEVWDKDVERYVRRELPVGGMELRDYFAARALPFCLLQLRDAALSIEDHASSAARHAYVIAAAMLVEARKA